MQMLDFLFLGVIQLAGQAIGHQHKLVVHHLKDHEAASRVASLQGLNSAADLHGKPLHHSSSFQTKPGRVRISGRPSSVMAMVCS